MFHFYTQWKPLAFLKIMRGELQLFWSWLLPPSNLEFNLNKREALKISLIIELSLKAKRHLNDIYYLHTFSHLVFIVSTISLTITVNNVWWSLRCDVAVTRTEIGRSANNFHPRQWKNERKVSIKTFKFIKELVKRDRLTDSDM